MLQMLFRRAAAVLYSGSIAEDSLALDESNEYETVTAVPL
jgi:hypothetical protein